MRLSSRIFAAVAVLFLLLAGTQNVFADSATFGFTFSSIGGGTSFSGSGTFTATLVSGNEYLVTSISGMQNGSAMTLLPPGAFADNNNNIFSSSPFLTLGGLAFVLSNGSTIYNIYYNPGYTGSVGYLECNNTAACNVGGEGIPIQFTLTEIPPTEVPEPGTLMLLGSGLIGLAGVARRKLLG